MAAAAHGWLARNSWRGGLAYNYRTEQEPELPDFHIGKPLVLQLLAVSHCLPNVEYQQLQGTSAEETSVHSSLCSL